MQNSSWYSDRNLNLQVHCDNLKQCIIHYSVNNGPQQNLEMPRNPQKNNEFNFAIANINADTPVTYSFTTISQEGVGCDSCQHNIPSNSMSNPPSAFNEDEWVQTFFDDFNGDEINRQIFNVIESDFNGNSEDEYYRDCPGNVRVENSCLILQANKEDYKGKHFTSGKVTTQGKFFVQYGRFEARIKMPNGCAVWPAWWLLCEKPNYIWAEQPEIDIVEVVGKSLNTAAGSVNYGVWPNNKYLSRFYKFPEGTDASTDFHIYGVDFQPNKLTYYIDGQIYGTIEPNDIAPYPFDIQHPYYLIFNLAVGGTLPGISADKQEHPQKMLIDWVKVLERKQ